MKKILVALLLLTASPVLAQTITEGGNAYDGVQGALVANNDAVRLNLRGTQWATVKFIVVTAGTATATAQITADGVNYLPAPYMVKAALSANPTTQAISATTLVAGDVWEVGLPSNVRAFQLLAGVGTSTTVKIVGGLSYVPGTSVTAVLADVTEGGIGNGIATTIFDISGWTNATVWCSSPTTQVFTVRAVDDGGSAMSGALAWTFPATAGAVAHFTRFGAHVAFPSSALTASQWVSGAMSEKRISVALPAGGTAATGRYRIAVSR